MALPASFIQGGYLTPQQARIKSGARHRRLMIGTEGRADTGKTEFILSAPGPGIVLCIDRGFDAVFDNRNPPTARRDDFMFKIITAPGPLQALQADYVKHHDSVREELYKAIGMVDAITIAIDGYSDCW